MTACASALILCAAALHGTNANANANAATRAESQPKSKSAIPDWNGVWVVADGFMDKQDGTSVAAPGRFNPNQAPIANAPALKGDYLKQALEMQKAQREGRPVDDRGALCLPQGMPSFWGGPYAFEIMQTGRQMNIYQEWNEQTRRVYLDGRAHPSADTLDPSYNGHSIGTWQNGVLLVDTVAIRAETAMRAGGGGTLGGHHSADMHITEKFIGEGKDLMRVEETVEDDKALERPWVMVVHLHRKQGMEVAEYVCEENNRNPVDSTGVTHTVLQDR